MKGHRPAYFAGHRGMRECPVYDRYALRAGASIAGPALIEERESTCVIGPGDRATVDARSIVVINVGSAAMSGYDRLASASCGTG